MSHLEDVLVVLLILGVGYLAFALAVEFWTSLRSDRQEGPSERGFHRSWRR